MCYFRFWKSNLVQKRGVVFEILVICHYFFENLYNEGL